MEQRLSFHIQPQPDETTCGPTCLHAIYSYWGDDLPLGSVIDEVQRLEDGGTLEVLLGLHALRRGYKARIYSYNLNVFDPSWFDESGRYKDELADKLTLQMRAKDDPKLKFASERYLEFLALGGQVRFQDLTLDLMRRYLLRRVPILSGLSATYLYRSQRELGSEFDDVRGEPMGHFVVVCGYNQKERKALVADPLQPSPLAQAGLYEVGLGRLNCAILLGIVTFDASLLVITPKESQEPREP